MSKKSVIITASIVGFLLLLSTILFGVVFCLRRQYVTIIGSDSLTYIDDNGQIQDITTDQIITAAGLKRGKSIFKVDTQAAKENIQKQYPSIKVVQVKIKSAISVDIVVRQRVATYYTEAYLISNEQVGYYLLDEDLVMLDAVTQEDLFDSVKDNYTKLTVDGLTNTGISRYQQLNTTWIKDITSSLLNAVCDTVKITDQEGTITINRDGEYVDREDFNKVVNSIQIVKATVPTGTTDQELKDRIEKMHWLIIKYGDITIKILKPEDDLKSKVNYSYNAVNSLEEGNKTIICAYKEDGSIKLTQDA